MDSREVFPHLAKICEALEDGEAASEAMVEHVMAGGGKEQISAIAGGDPLVFQPPPPGWQSWADVEAHRVMNRSLSSRLDAAEVDLRDPQWTFGKRPFHAAAMRGDGYTLRRLLISGQDPNGVWDDATPLHFIVACNRLDLIELLISRGANVRGPFAPVLVYARSARAVHALVAHGAELDGQDAKGRTALIAAVDVGRNEVAKALIQEGASLDAKDLSGRTALSIALGSNRPDDYAELISLLSGGPAPT
jgi:ankyrin repeat protein